MFKIADKTDTFFVELGPITIYFKTQSTFSSGHRVVLAFVPRGGLSYFKRLLEVSHRIAYCTLTAADPGFK